MAENDLGQALDFDGEIEAAEGFETLPAGEYEYEVVSVTRGQFNGSEKVAPCPTARVRVRVVGGPYEGASLLEDLKLNSKFAWVITKFFVSCGLRDANAPKEQRLKMDWAGAIGRRGRCKVTCREYNGSTYNDVEWLRPAATPRPGAF